MKSSPKRANGGWSVVVIGRCNDNRVEFFELEESSVVGEFLRFRMSPGGRIQTPLIDVTKRDYVLTGDAGEIASTSPAHSDATDVQAFIRPKRSAGCPQGKRGDCAKSRLQK